MTLIFIHGAGGSSRTWRLQTVHFEDALAVDLPGHTEGPGFSTIEDYVAFIENLVDTRAIRNPILVGHSMGGAIAMTYALRNSNLTGLVLVGTGARLRVDPTILTKIRENYKEASEVIAAWSVSPACDSVIVDRLVTEILKVNPEVTYGDFAACDKFDRMNDLEKITCRTLIVCGSDDRLTPVKYSRYLHGKIRDSELVVIPGAGHSVMLEKHRTFNETLDAFLDSLSVSGSSAET
jgi:pimeloyl-ACP methyl ester carboxylesterase